MTDFAAIDFDVPDDVIHQLLKAGYGLIVKSFSAKKRKELGLI